MDAIAIISPKGERLFDVVVTPEAVEHEELMQSHYIQLAWTDKTCDILRAGSYITYNGIRYTLLEPYQPQHRDELFYEYKPRFTAEEYTWRKHPFFLVTENERGQAISFEPSWTLTSSADQFMECISKAIKLQTGEAWSVITESKYEVETTTLTFDNTDILSALNAIANAFKTEWWIDRAAHAIHLSEARYMKPTGIVDLRVGQNVTMPSISDSKDEFYNRYYAFGSSRNITQDTQLASANTITQKRLTLDPVKYPNGYIDLEDNPAHVYSKIIYFDDIYPKADLRVGELQKVRKYKRTSQSDESKIVIGTTADGQPIFDTYAVWYFSLPNFTFNNSTYSTDNPNGNLLPGLTLSVNFKSGSLRGREFELSYIDKAITVTDEVSGSKVNIPSAWYCIKFVEQNGYVIPAAEDLIPKTGDEVTLFNIHLPQSYVSSAQTKLEEALRTYIGEFDQDTATYEVQSFATAFADHDPMLSVGALVTLDRTMGGTLLSRVKRIERRLDLPYIQTITIGNNLAKGTIGNLREDLRQAEADLKRLYVATEATQQAVREAPRRYNDIRETTQMLQDALLEGFTEGISPLSVQTMQQIVGSEALQYRFVKSWNASTYEETQPSIYYDKTARTLTIGTSRIQHMTLGITTVTSGTVAPTDTLRWNVSPFTSSSLTEPSQPYYLYARVNRYTDRSQIGTGSFRLEATAHALKEEANYYWLLVGFLNTETSGDRSFATMYGYTEILPGRITTDRIAASNGKLIIDLSTATIYAETLETKGLDEAPTNVSERFKAVDTEVTKANSTATAAQSTANAAQKAVDDIEFGGRNLLRNSAFVDTSYWTKQGAAVIRKSSSLSGCMVIEKVRAGAVFDGMHQIVPFSGKGVLTFKAQVLTANSTWLAIIHFLDSASNIVSQTTILISSTAMTDYKLAFAPTQTTIKQAKVIFCTANNNTIANAQLCVVKPQLENGTKPTAWTPAPEDLEQKLTDLDYLKQTFGSGGANVGTIYLAKALVVHDGSTARNVTSGMDGTADVQSSATPMLWAGSQNFNSRSSAAFRVYANGHVDMNDVSIYGGDEANGSVYVDGEKISISKQGKLLSLSSQSLASLDVDTTIENVEQINLTNPITTAKSYTLNVNTGLAKYSTSVSQQIFTYTFAVTSSFYGYPSVGLKVEWTSLVDSSSIKSKRIYVQNMKGDSEMTGTSGEIGYSNPYTPSAGSDTKSLSFSVTIYAEVEYYGPHNNGSCTFKVTPLARSRFPLTVTTKRIANIIAPNALLMKQDSSHYFGIKCDADDLFKASNGNFTLKFNKTSGLMQGNRPAVSPLVLVVRVYLDAQGVYTRTILYNPLNKTVAVKRYNNWTGACTVTHNLGVDSYTCSVICEGHSYGFIDAGTKAKNSVTIGTADDNSRNDMAFEISFFQY